jgi:hypothetical protein
MRHLDYIDAILNETASKSITQKLSEFEFPERDVNELGEYFGWYNPDTKEIRHNYSIKYSAKPKGNWYSWHSHPKGSSGHPSEIDLIGMIEMNDSGPNYSYGKDGLYEQRIDDMKEAKQSWNEIKKEQGIKNFHAFIDMHNENAYSKKQILSLAKKIGAVIKHTKMEHTNTNRRTA